MNTIKLEKGIINFMLSFRIGSAWAFDSADTGDHIWEKTDEDLPKLDFLLDHVKDFFTRNFQLDKLDDSSCLILKLKKEALPVKMFNNRTYWLSNKSFDIHDKVKNAYKIPVQFDPGSFRIIIHPFTRVAILLFCAELANQGKNTVQCSLADFIQMNYLFRLFNRHDEAFFISQNERTEERSKAAMFVTGKTPDLFGKDAPENIELTGWRPGQLINYLLYDLHTRYRVEFFDHHRFYPVCYAQPAEEIRDEGIIHRALFFLRKVYDFDYSPASDVLQRESELFNPFRQIYYANSLEGAAVFNNCSSSDPEFIRTFYSNSFPKSLWLTILGAMQRSIFLQLMKEVSGIDPDDQQMVKLYLKRYTRISLKALFSKVSVYHQHNDYYVMMIHNLQINELQTELKDELNELNNLQRQFHEDEVEKSDEIEKQYDKRLNMILFALSVFGLTELIYTVLGNSSMSFFQHSLAFGIPIFLGLIFWILVSVRKR